MNAVCSRETEEDCRYPQGKDGRYVGYQLNYCILDPATVVVRTIAII